MQPLAHGASSSVDHESQKNTEATWDHYLHISPNKSPIIWKQSSPWPGKICGKQPGDPTEVLNVNLAIWRMFMNTTLRAAVHLGKDYDMNLRFIKNCLWKTTGQLFRGTEKADQWSDRTHKHKPDQFPRFEVGIDKLIAQSSLSIFHCQSPCLL